MGKRLETSKRTLLHFGYARQVTGLTNRTVIELLNLSRRFDGDYDGWETPVVT